MVVFLRLALRRVAMLPVMILGVTALVFVVLQFSPVDPAYNALGDSATPQARAAFAAANGLNSPLPVRYVRFLGQLLHGNLGLTLPPSQSVSGRIATAFPLTLQLTLLALVIAIALALVLGITGAVYRDRWPDQLSRVLSIAGVAIPSFWLGILLIQEFAISHSLLPSGGYVNPAQSLGGWLRTMLLPAFSLAFPVAATLSRMIRTSLVAELDRDYVRTATGNGLSRATVIRGALRNALVTPLTVLGLQVGYLLSGAVVIETIFNLPGMGSLVLEGVTAGDISLVQGTVLTVALAFLVVNVLVDLLVLLVNPRLRTV
ncbi:ABC transporter permease [Streptacidiphilus sp. P02-A3a]|uniref:ABC transporter permease n=1 Tax=Streptacidiphilus sp. P02-A3a TaxID=2704468 RepID=UPI0015FE018A|nr:ABC transporter permease [Streptacidiphilus sp. P02-A3a]QMU71229.1 ABC transporter permease [Streptacidiphilus sp. P02-A3a]